jgi:hypothetical protein
MSGLGCHHHVSTGDRKEKGRAGLFGVLPGRLATAVSYGARSYHLRNYVRYFMHKGRVNPKIIHMGVARRQIAYVLIARVCA